MSKLLTINCKHILLQTIWHLWFSIQFPLSTNLFMSICNPGKYVPCPFPVVLLSVSHIGDPQHTLISYCVKTQAQVYAADCIIHKDMTSKGINKIMQHASNIDSIDSRGEPVDSIDSIDSIDRQGRQHRQ